MTPEERSLLERTHKLAEENNEILRGIRRSNRISVIFRVAYWVIILAISFGAFYFIQPYIESLTGAYGQIQQEYGSTQGAISSFRDLLK